LDLAGFLHIQLLLFSSSFGLEGKQAAFVLCIPKTACSLATIAPHDRLFLNHSILDASRRDTVLAMLVSCDGRDLLDSSEPWQASQVFSSPDTTNAERPSPVYGQWPSQQVYTLAEKK
jgi:hypothetical protein